MNRTKRRIFNTAIKLFSEKGYENTSIEEITAVAGVAKGSGGCPLQGLLSCHKQLDSKAGGGSKQI